MDECPHCGEPLPEKAESCPHCGSDFETGWKPDTDYYAVELPDDATPAQRARFEAGQGGALVPLMCVDKTPQELA